MAAARPSSIHSSPPVYTAIPVSTLPLYRRLLFPALPTTSPLPPLFAHGPPELSVAAYELIALILRAHINPWYTKLSRDKTFVPHIAAVLSRVLQDVEKRALAADLPALVYNVLPTLAVQHYDDYRFASCVGSASTSSISVAETFHTLEPHIALLPETDAIDLEYLRQAIERAMKLCMPPEDWDAEAERFIVREILVGPVLGGLLPRLSQPWFLYGLMLGALRKPQGATIPKNINPNVPTVGSKRQLIVFSITTLHSITSTVHSTVAFLQVASSFLASLPPKSTGLPTAPGIPPNYASGVLLLLATLLNFPSRLVTAMLLSYLSLMVSLFQSLLDRILIHLLSAYVLTPRNITSIINRTGVILYPNGVPAPPVIVPSLDQQQAIREALESRLLELLSVGPFSLVLGATADARKETVRSLLDPLSNAACNVHLIMRLFDAILLSLFPELSADGVAAEPNVIQPSSAEPSDVEEESKEGFATPSSH